MKQNKVVLMDSLIDYELRFMKQTSLVSIFPSPSLDWKYLKKKNAKIKSFGRH